MSVNPGGPIILDLSGWAERGVNEIIQATSAKALDQALGKFLAKDANITINGHHVTKYQWKKQLRGTEADELKATVNFQGAVSAATPKSGLEETVSILACFAPLNFSI